MSQTTRVVWKGHRIEFLPVLSHRALWIATHNELWFDGALAATSGGFHFSSRAEATVQHDGKPVSIAVESSTCWRSLIDLNYTLTIDGEMISKGIARTKVRW